MELFWYRTPTDQPLGTVMLSHGYAEHHRRFLPLIEALQAAGYDVVAYDHQGHGTSPGWRSMVDVGRLISTHIAQRRIALGQARTPSMFLFGHSMGGLITAASALLDAHAVDGVVLTGPAFVPQPAIPLRVVKTLLPVARLLPWLPATIVPQGLLSTDPAVQKAFNADRLTYKGPVPLRTGLTMTLQGHETMAHAPLMRVPLLILHGSEDRLTSPFASQEFVARIRESNPQADAEFLMISGARHEVLNEPDGAERVEEIIAWLDAHTPTASATISRRATEHPRHNSAPLDPPLAEESSDSPTIPTDSARSSSTGRI